MAAEGRTVIFISHKLHEVMAVSDRVTVLRDGRSVATVDDRRPTPRSLAALMVGPRARRRYGGGGEHAEIGDVVLELEGVSARRRPRRRGAARTSR